MIGGMTDDATPPVLDQINLVVSDMAATVEFYRRLGLKVADFGPPMDAHHRSAGPRGGIHLDFDSEAFASKWNQSHTPGQIGPVIGFRCATREAVDRTYADLTGAGHRGHQAPYDAFWGSRYAIVADPDGNLVGLMSPRDPAMVSPPPDPTA
jgi:catechol 2,3-dioxygenase-like lactoylglutathione lyase family enzyme